MILRVLGAVGWHEVGHLLGARIMGIPMAYYSTDLNHVHWLGLYGTPMQRTVIYLSGGLLCALFFLGLNLEQEDPENNIANWSVGLLNFVYSIGEALLPAAYWDHAILLAQLIALAVVVLLMLWGSKEWKI